MATQFGVTPLLPIEVAPQQEVLSAMRFAARERRLLSSSLWNPCFDGGCSEGLSFKICVYDTSPLCSDVRVGSTERHESASGAFYDSSMASDPKFEALNLAPVPRYKRRLLVDRDAVAGNVLFMETRQGAGASPRFTGQEFLGIVRG